MCTGQTCQGDIITQVSAVNVETMEYAKTQAKGWIHGTHSIV